MGERTDDSRLADEGGQPLGMMAGAVEGWRRLAEPDAWHPATRLFPLMDDAQLAELAADIKALGHLQEPVAMMDGKVLDGRNRLRACIITGVTPDFIDVSESSPTVYVIRKNLRRLHLTPDQRAALAVEIRPQIEREMRGRMAEGGRRGAKTRMRTGTGKGVPDSGTPSPRRKRPGPKARDVLSAMTGASKEKIDRARRLKAHDPARFERVRAGEEPLPPHEQQKSPQQRQAEGHLNFMLRHVLDDLRTLRAHQDDDLAGIISGEVRDEIRKDGPEALGTLRRVIGVLGGTPVKRSPEQRRSYVSALVSTVLTELQDVAAQEDSKIVEMVDASVLDRVRMEGTEAVATLEHVVSLLTADPGGQASEQATGA